MHYRWLVSVIALCRDPSTRHLETEYRWVEIWWTGKKMKEQKKSSKTIDIVSYALKVGENGVTCVFVVHFRSSDTFKSL